MIAELKRMLRKLRRKSKKAYRSGFQNESVPMDSSPALWVSTSTSTNDMDAMRTTNEVPSENIKIMKEDDKRLEKKPAEVFKEIIAEEPNLNFINLNKQIRTVKKRKEFLKEEMNLSVSDEKLALKYLQARKKYLKYSKKLRWAITTKTKIDELCKKYKVKLVSFGGYYKNIPMEAIDELENYIDIHERITKDKPVFHLIIDDGGKEQRKDPILLAESPFGRWYYILGAWDKEVEIVDDLVYKGK